MNDKDKKFYYLFLPIAVIMVAAAVIYITVYKEKKTEEIQTLNMLPIPDVDADTAEVSKIDGYARLAERDNNKERERKLMDNKDFFGISDEQETEKNDRMFLYEEKETAAPAPEIKAATTKRQAVKQATVKTEVKERIVYVQAPAVKTPEPEPEQVYYNSFAVHSGNNTAAVSETGSGDVYLLAVLEENQKLKDGTQLTFIAKDEFTYKNILIKKASILYGVASVSESNIDITINKVRLPSTELKDVKLSGYNENYQKGIHFKGKGDAVIKDAANTTIKNGVDVASGGKSRMANNFVRGSSKSVEADAEVFIAKGYVMYFK